MSTIKQIEERVATLEKGQESAASNIAILAKTQLDLKDMGARLDRSIANHAERMAILQDLLVSLNQAVSDNKQMLRGHQQMLRDHQQMFGDHEQMLRNHEAILARQDEKLEEMRRFNRQTRRLYVLIARKANWLDEDDIAEWENDND